MVKTKSYKIKERLFKLISCLRHLSGKRYTQHDILFLLNYHLKNEELKEIKLPTLRKDLGFLMSLGVLKRFLVRHGKNKGSSVVYFIKSLQSLKNYFDNEIEKGEKDYSLGLEMTKHIFKDKEINYKSALDKKLKNIKFEKTFFKINVEKKKERQRSIEDISKTIETWKKKAKFGNNW